MMDEHGTLPEAVVIGGSAGGGRAVSHILQALPDGLPVPILVVLHIAPGTGPSFPASLRGTAGLTVALAEDKVRPGPREVHVAPPDYHLLVDPDGGLALSQDERVNYTRPSIDVLFDSAAEFYGAALVGVVLTGANADGSLGLRRIQEFGGTTIVQDPDTAAVAAMPASALRAVTPDHVCPVSKIGPLLLELCGGRGEPG